MNSQQQTYLLQTRGKEISLKDWAILNDDLNVEELENCWVANALPLLRKSRSQHQREACNRLSGYSKEARAKIFRHVVSERHKIDFLRPLATKQEQAVAVLNTEEILRNIRYKGAAVATRNERPLKKEATLPGRKHPRPDEDLPLQSSQSFSKQSRRAVPGILSKITPPLSAACLPASPSPCYGSVEMTLLNFDEPLILTVPVAVDPVVLASSVVLNLAMPVVLELVVVALAAVTVEVDFALTELLVAALKNVAMIGLPLAVLDEGLDSDVTASLIVAIFVPRTSGDHLAAA
ncbi:hypothetical protein BCR41DRAFT_399582 [Lobosporangium transversale]|uniref:Uncharacterized protein n=1 Tax=Lobosporangium transversale TaxID=64571 RepID=A0A1Y2GEM2_9FUNG|nr:hypothetical protein BCR41DRAFT_399582 [Lobosporangium transversale]ORZ07766.1 hypothetical protein BCR41DRAFT_399582 [Lobosporangium transversale]|eukprot:XP_021878132.1 hypothetical protein BCR41DRAFT_399582 [Lobosporangium transversale]